MKCGMSCSLFEVVDGKGKPTNGSLAALVSKLERDRMVSHCEGFTCQVLMLQKSAPWIPVCQQNMDSGCQVHKYSPFFSV